MFSYDEYVVISHIGSSSRDTCLMMLRNNLDEIEDEFTKEFLTNLIVNIENLDDWKYSQTIENADFKYAFLPNIFDLESNLI